MPGGTTVPYKKTKHKTFNAFCIQLAFLVNTKSQTGGSRSGCELGGTVSSMEQPMGSMLVTGKRKSIGTRIGERAQTQTADSSEQSMHRPRGESDTCMSMSAQRGGDHMTETLLISKPPPPPQNPGSENLTDRTYLCMHTHSSYYGTVAEKLKNSQLFKYINFFFIFSQS